MTVLYTIEDALVVCDDITAMKELDWNITMASSKTEVLKQCTTNFFDVIIINTKIPYFDWKETIKDIRDKQILTPILVITDNHSKQSKTAGLLEGADMCLYFPYEPDELILRVRTLKRRNTNYQAKTIDYNNLHLNRADCKIAYNDLSFSVNTIEIEIFRLLTRASEPLNLHKLADKIGEPADEVMFFARCLQKKIDMLRSNVSLTLNGDMCELQ